ncbi:hypothetical protein TrLO_g9704, partial [Triparma laevis f. longispina]
DVTDLYSPHNTAHHFWDFRGCTTGADVTDSIAGDLVASPVNDPVCGTDGIKLDGSDDYVDIGAFHFGGTTSIEVYVKFDSFSENSRVFDFNEEFLRLFNQATSTEMTWEVQASGGLGSFTNTLSASNFDSSVWTHAVVTVSKTGLRMYKNGVLVGSARGREPEITTRSQMRIGSGDDANYFDGTVAYLKIWHGVELQQSDVTGLYSPDHKAHHFWDFRGCTTGASVADSMGGDLVATPINGPQCSADGISLDGSNDYVGIDDWEWGGTTSIEAYFKSDSSNSSSVLDFNNVALDVGNIVDGQPTEINWGFSNGYDAILSLSPYAYFKRGTFSSDGTVWPDSSPHGRNAAICSGCAVVSSSGNGLNEPRNVLSGGTSAAVNFGDVLPNGHTICSATRYSGTTKRCILSGTSSPHWLHGHNFGSAGVAHFTTGWLGSSSSRVTPVTDWVMMCSIGGNSKPMVVNGQEYTVSGGNSNSPGELRVNSGTYSGYHYSSDFEISDIVTFDMELTVAQMKIVISEFEAGAEKASMSSRISASSFGSSVWTHVVATVSDTSMKIYKNSVLEASQISTPRWKLVCRQTAGTYFGSDEFSKNPDDPSNDNFAILDQLESLRGADGKFEFKLSWPADGLEDQHWRQTSNPVVGVAGGGVEGYESISTPYSGQGWGGLERSGAALFDGSTVGEFSGNHWYSVGTYEDYYDGMPGPADVVISEVELWVMDTRIQVPDVMPRAMQTIGAAEGGADLNFEGTIGYLKMWHGVELQQSDV